MPTVPSVLGSRIRQARRQAELSQSQLASKVGAHVTSVSDWERGVNRPRIETLAAIAEETGKTLDWFVEPRDPFRETAEAAA
jgi:transcriptional regulator with XRE-family HTH domain